MIFSRQIHILCGIITAEGVGTQKALILVKITILLLTSYTGWYMTVQAQHTAGTLAPQVMTSFCSGSSLSVSWALTMARFTEPRPAHTKTVCGEMGS